VRIRIGRWLGVCAGDPWWSADCAQAGSFVGSLVEVVPDNTFWTACFYPGNPVVDVDIVLPARWDGDLLEEVDLEQDILRSASGTVWVRDEEGFAHVREAWALPDEIATQALTACEEGRALVTAGAEPFGTVGRGWLSRFMTRTGLTN
jgi:hypothetical protein